MPTPPRAVDPGARFRRKYGLRTDRSTAAAVRGGLESGYPDCCILFFVVVWSMLDEPGRDRYRAFIDRLAPAGPGYIPCPRCLLEGNLVRPMACGGDACPPAG